MKIQFYPSSRDTALVVPPPKPAAFYIPEWYKKIPKFAETDLHLNDNGRVEGVNIKSCMPFLDSMINGYIQETWQDIIVEHRDGKLTVASPSGPQITDSRGDNFHSPIGKGFYQNEFVWKAPWIPRMPKGWSILYTSPANHSQLPFETATGIVDADNFYHSPFGNLPFYIKHGFTGRIPAGTPMYQMIPVKRESWESEVMPWNEPEQRKRIAMVASKAYGAYKDLFHTKKEFR
jgi:hypothetical protein